MDKARVWAAMPSRGDCVIESRFAYYFATKGGCSITPALSKTSLLGRAFNLVWADALNYAKEGIVDYFLLHHDDIEPRTMGWLDVMVEESRRVGAAVLSAVVPMKCEGGKESSTAMHLPGTWKTRKFKMEEVWRLPETFCTADVKRIMNLPGELVNNSGLMLIDLNRPEFRRCTDGYADFLFTVQDRMPVDAEGKFKVETWSEDWDFSARCNKAGLPVYSTWKIEVMHYGGGEWSNQPPKKEVA